jgi:hypothetical protein
MKGNERKGNETPFPCRHISRWQQPLSNKWEIQKNRANACRGKSNASHTKRLTYVSEIKNAMSQFAKLLIFWKE